MAKDDYYVIVYQILSYLYQRLKKGEDVDPKQISWDSDFFSINKKYWNYIMVNLIRQGLIDGIRQVEIDNAPPMITHLDGCQITPAGIAFLSDNSTIEKAKQFFKDAKEMIPFA